MKIGVFRGLLLFVSFLKFSKVIYVNLCTVLIFIYLYTFLSMIKYMMYVQMCT